MNLLNVPNMITISRFFLYIWGFINFTRPWLLVSLYSTATALDGIDGYFARKLNQCTRTGQVLDMIVDRSSHIYLFGLFCKLLPDWFLFFSSLSVLDIVSHWCLTYLKPVHHKKMDENVPALMNIYYTTPYFMDILMFFEESGYMLLYLNIMNIQFGFYLSLLTPISILGWGLKTFINAQQLWHSMSYMG